MTGVRLFRREDQDFNYSGDVPAAVLAFVNAGNSDTMGGGFGVFGAGCDIEWTVTYDEFIFIHQGCLKLKIADDIYDAGPGDTLWIPKDTPLSYIADEDVWFFFAVYPATSSPSASQVKQYPSAAPRSSSQAS